MGVVLPPGPPPGGVTLTFLVAREKPVTRCEPKSEGHMAPQILMQVGPCRPNKMGKKGGCRHTPVCPESLHPPLHGAPGSHPRTRPPAPPPRGRRPQAGWLRHGLPRTLVPATPKRGPLRVTPKGLAEVCAAGQHTPRGWRLPRGGSERHAQAWPLPAGRTATRRWGRLSRRGHSK